MKHPMKYVGTYPSNWAGYYFKERLGYTSGVHTGVDYNHGTDDFNDPIYAIASGKVVRRISNGTVGGFGNAIIIETNETPPGVSGKKLYHRYLHLNAVYVKKGDTVKMGQRIATVGNTGGVPAHLHLDTWTDRNGLGAHWNYHKDTRLSSYEDAFKLIAKNPKWDEAGDDMTKAQAQGIVKALYKGLFGRKADKGGLDNYTNQVLNGRYAFTVNDMVGSQEFKNRHVKTKTVTKKVVDTKKVDELSKALKIKDNEIKRLEKEVKKLEKKPKETQKPDTWQSVFGWAVRQFKKLDIRSKK